MASEATCGHNGAEACWISDWNLICLTALAPRVKTHTLRNRTRAMHRCGQRSAMVLAKLAHCILITRYDDQMEVIGHKTPSPNLRARLCQHDLKKRQIGLIVIIAKENLLTPITPLGHVMRQIGNNKKSNARHRPALSLTFAIRKSFGYCHRYFTVILI